MTVRKEDLANAVRVLGEKPMNIVVNSREYNFFGSQISYEEIVKLAGKTGNPSVTYRGPTKGDSLRKGNMHADCAAVELEEGMIFNVQHTGGA